MFNSLLLLVSIDVKSILAVLFWGNLAAFFLIISYQYTGAKFLQSQKPAQNYILAKLFQAAAHFFLLSGNSLPDILSVNLGNSLLLTGFYMEALALLRIAQNRDQKLYAALKAVFITGLALFNSVELFWPDSSIRVAAPFVCIFFILMPPGIKLLAYARTGGFKQTIGIFYLFFALLLLPRAVLAFSGNSGALIHTFILSLTLVSLVMLMIFGLSAYLLLMKELAHKEIAQLAVTDSLTGLSNRKSFLDAAEAVFERHKTNKTSLTVLFMDIDHFKQINDTHGHSFGDEVLVKLGATIRNTLRGGDLSCRYGGEEFLILLPNTNLENFKVVTQRIRKSIAIAAFERKPGFSFTVSIGVMSGIPVVEDTPAFYLEKADEALYHAKNTGRDKVVEYQADLVDWESPRQSRGDSQSTKQYSGAGDTGRR
ncbi:MAG: GGDEF domain-containing protein [Deltaproteobacteria bacterium]|jgi:diguanylate cyclase (GGDEF)-like protein|nr:GGDEF domain-containing protein [Deltaproteobacteria bacterium]